MEACFVPPFCECLDDDDREHDDLYVDLDSRFDPERPTPDEWFDYISEIFALDFEP